MEIKNEEHFDKAKDVLIKEAAGFKSDKFLDLETRIKEVLDKSQDSETALKLITK